MADEKKPEKKGRRATLYDHEDSVKARAQRNEGEKKTSPEPKGREAEDGEMMTRHQSEHAEMDRRHENERRDHHERHRQAMRAMAARHKEERDGEHDMHARIGMHRRHEAEIRAEHQAHHHSTLQMHGRHHEEKMRLHEKHEKELIDKLAAMHGPGTEPGKMAAAA